jgi:dCTP deaminase
MWDHRECDSLRQSGRFVTLEISNTTPLPAKIYANEGLAQVLFFEADEECEVSYADKKGKYQKQQSIVLPKL